MKTDATEMTNRPKAGISAFAIRNAHLTVAIFIALMIIGLVCTRLIPKDLLPASSAPAVQIISFYPGMPVEDVEQEITFPYERYTGQAVGTKSQDSRSLTGVSIVRNYFHSNIDLSAAIAQTGALVLSVLRKLPNGTQPPLILPFDRMASQPLALCAVSGEDRTEAELQDLARYRVTNAIQSVAGAVAPTVMGGKLRQALIILNNNNLNKFNFSPISVNEKLKAMNSFIPAGDVNIGDINYQLHSNAMFKNLNEVNEFFLRSQDGVTIKLKDVGEVKDGAARQTNIVTVNGKREAFIPIYRQLGSNSLEVIDSVKDTVRDLQKTLQHFNLQVINDQTIFIRKAIEAISIEGMIGGGLAALMIFLFLGSGRATIAVLLTLPISIVGAIAVLNLCGQTLNVMTLGGLALSIGVLVDNAIVVIEVIMAKQLSGLSPQEAALAGAQEVAMPVLASTIATLIVFVPIVFLHGIVETLFAALSLAVVSSLAISYFAAMMMVPLYAYNYLGVVRTATAGLLGGIQNSFIKIKASYGSSLRKALSQSGPILKLSLFLHAGVALILVPYIGTEVFPRADAGSFSLQVRGPTGLRIEKTGELVTNIETTLRHFIPSEDLKFIISNSGIYYGYSAAFTPNSGSQDSVLNVVLTEKRAHTSQYYVGILRSELQKIFPGVEFSFQLGGLLSSALNGGLPSPIDIQISGENSYSARNIAESLLQQVKKVNGASDVRIQQRFDSPILNIQLDREKISNFGLTPDLVVKNLVSAVSNSSSFDQQVWVDPRTGMDYLLGVQYPENSFHTKEELLTIPVTSIEQNRSVPLSKFSTVRISKGATEINHYNLIPTVDIYLDAENRDIGSVAADVQKIINNNVIPANYTVQIKGEIAEIKTSLASLGWGFLLAVCLVYLILLAQFRSFLMPAIILTNVPKGIVGVIMILALTKTYFSIQAAIGCIFVIGVSVSHSVLLLEYIIEKVKHSSKVEEAIVEACMARLRPITMTSLASILGLMPMAIGIGHGSEANIPLGRAVIGGQILSTFLNFYLLPCLYHQMRPKKAKTIPTRIQKAA